MKQGWSRALKVTLFLGRRLGGRRRQPLLASGLLLLNKDLQFFSSVNGSVSSAPIGAYPIEVPNADQDAELFEQCCLHHTTGRVGRLSIRAFQPLEHRYSQLQGVPMPSIVQGDFSVRTNIGQ